MKKREFGSLRRIGSGRWQARYLDPAGLRRTAPTTFATKAEALRWLSAAQTDMARGGWQDPQLGDVAFREWAERFLASRVDLKPKTLSDYESLLHARILPKFAEWPIGRIRPMDVQDWIAAMTADGLSASRVRQGAHLLGSILSAAVNEGMIPTNPAQQARLPRLPRREMEFYDAEQVERLASAAASPYGTLIHVLAYGGLRFGEAAALRRGACDLDRGRLIVRESLADVRGQLHFGSTKTHQRREIVLPTFLVELMVGHLEAHVAPEPSALVFTSPRGGPLRYGNFLRNIWVPALRAAHLPATGVHILRHTCATLLISQGAPVKAIQAQLGHASPELTLGRYGHLYPDDLDALAVRLDAARASALKQTKVQELEPPELDPPGTSW
ncbi:MAG TPA: tyrosine-type recombinase/integrase [Acidimicrobiales bacterium]|nr:tyrosine-type recombinase/integrase [Acidimicrobiales bacterium]